MFHHTCPLFVQGAQRGQPRLPALPAAIHCSHCTSASTFLLATHQRKHSRTDNCSSGRGARTFNPSHRGDLEGGTRACATAAAASSISPCHDPPAVTMWAVALNTVPCRALGSTASAVFREVERVRLRPSGGRGGGACAPSSLLLQYAPVPFSSLSSCVHGKGREAQACSGGLCWSAADYVRLARAIPHTHSCSLHSQHFYLNAQGQRARHGCRATSAAALVAAL